MNASPYVRAPDALWLQFLHAPPDVEIVPFESAHGTTDEFLCYYRGTLVGLETSHGRGSGLLLNLLPKLDQRRGYPWPSSTQFQESVVSLLRQTQGWSLVCEQDCDQRPVPEVRGFSQLVSKLAEACAYSKGEASACPTFKATADSLDA